MSNDVKHARVSSISANLARAVALAAVLVPFGSVRSEASSIAITHTYSDPDDITSRSFDFEGGSSVLGGYSFELTFDQLAAGAVFDLTVVAEALDPSDLEPRFNNNFPGSQCVTFATDGTQCVDFQIKGEDASTPFPTTDPTKWIGSFDITISWFLDTNGQFPNGPSNRIRILHNRGDSEGDGFDTDVTVNGSYFPGCGQDCFLASDDPAIGGRDDNFQSFAAVQAPDPIPEPATMLLLGSGLIGLVQQRRRRLKSL